MFVLKIWFTQRNKANTSDTKATFLDLHFSISNDIVSNNIYDKRDDFDFAIVNFSFRWQSSSHYFLWRLYLSTYLEHQSMWLTSTLIINC